jgi:hypothetical protein
LLSSSGTTRIHRSESSPSLNGRGAAQNRIRCRYLPRIHGRPIPGNSTAKMRSAVRRLSAGMRFLSTTAAKTRMSGPGRLLLTRGLPPLAVASVFGAHFSVITSFPSLCLRTLQMMLDIMRHKQPAARAGFQACRNELECCALRARIHVGFQRDFCQPPPCLTPPPASSRLRARMRLQQSRPPRRLSLPLPAGADCSTLGSLPYPCGDKLHTHESAQDHVVGTGDMPKAGWIVQVRSALTYSAVGAGDSTQNASV